MTVFTARVCLFLVLLIAVVFQALLMSYLYYKGAIYVDDMQTGLLSIGSAYAPLSGLVLPTLFIKPLKDVQMNGPLLLLAGFCVLGWTIVPCGRTVMLLLAANGHGTDSMESYVMFMQSIAAPTSALALAGLGYVYAKESDSKP
jgi:hypothetical protein